MYNVHTLLTSCCLKLQLMFKLDLHNPIFDTTTAALILRRPNLYTGMHQEEEEEKQEGEEEKADKDMKEEEDVQ